MPCTPVNSRRERVARSQFVAHPRAALGFRRSLATVARNNRNTSLPPSPGSPSISLPRNNDAVCSSLARGARFPATSISYSSLSGDAALIGFSGFRPDGNADADGALDAPWNSGPVLKWRRKSRSGANGFYHPITGPAGTTVLKNGYGGSEYFDAATAAYTNACTAGSDGATAYEPDVAPAWDTLSPVLAASSADLPSIFSPPQGYSRTLTALSIVDTGGGSFPPDWFHYSTVLVTLSDPDTYFDALTRAEADEGTASETLPGTYDLTSPEAFGLLEFTDVTAVRADILVFGLLPGNVYTLRAVYALRPLAGGALAFESHSEPYLAPGFEAEIRHILPVRQGYGVSLASFTLTRSL